VLETGIPIVRQRTPNQVVDFILQDVPVRPRLAAPKLNAAAPIGARDALRVAVETDA